MSLLFNVDCQVKFEEGYPATMNSPQLRNTVEQAIVNAGLEVVEKPLPFYLEKILVSMVNNLLQLILHLLERVTKPKLYYWITHIPFKFR